MVLDLRSLFANDGKAIPLDLKFDLSDVDFYGFKPLKSPVSVKGRAFSRAGIVMLSVQCDCEYTAPCDRCGVDTVKEYVVSVDKSLASSIEGDDSDTILLVPDMKLNLDEFLYSEVIMSLPMKHVCSEMCKGICQKCGKNLNEGDCGCEKKEIDPRLQVLADLLK